MSTREHHERIEALEQNPELLPLVEVRWENINRETSQESDTEAELKSSEPDWPDPEPLGGELLPVQAFDSQLLPAALRPLAEDVAERMQVPLDYPAVVAVLCFSGVTNRRATIQPKSADTSWVVVPNLWGGIIAPPGLMKSPVISAITQPLARIEADWRGEYATAESIYKQQQEESKLRHSAWQDRCKANFKKAMDAPPRPVEEAVAPTCRRLITQDATFESLHALMSENPAGIFVIRDEYTGWLAGLERPGREGERAFYLQAWNGDSSFTIDRIGRGSVHVEACCVSMLGGIQPARLRAYLADALKDGPSNDGLMQRFQVLVYPDISGDWRYVDRQPNSAAREQAEQVYRQLANIDALKPLTLKFAPDAQELFVEWIHELEHKLRSDELHPALVSHLAKYRKLMPALALLFELAGRWD